MIFLGNLVVIIPLQGKTRKIRKLQHKPPRYQALTIWTNSERTYDEVNSSNLHGSIPIIQQTRTMPIYGQCAISVIRT